MGGMLKAAFKGYYPGFVFGSRTGREMPVFYCHHTEKAVFSRQLAHLKNNGYQTAIIADLDSDTSEAADLSKKNVLLTFDDGYRDLYTIVYPLLMKYGFRAVAFISPYWIDEPGYITWKQAEEMERSGVIDFQSHSYSHANIPVSGKVVDLYDPQIADVFKKEVPILTADEGLPVKRPPYGTPVYEFASGLSDRRRFISNGNLEEWLQNVYREEGTRLSAAGTGMKKEVLKRSRMFQAGNGPGGVLESEAQQLERLRREVRRSKAAIEEKLPVKKVTAFACPRHQFGRLLFQQLHDAGFIWVFCGLVPPPMDPHWGFTAVRRVNADFILRLPGSGRDGMAGPFIRKLKTRMGAGST